MGVDVQVALRPDFEIEHAVARHLIEHVVEKRYSRGKIGPAAAIDVDGKSDLGLGGLAVCFCGAR
jgi:hypothetical protein